MGTDKALLQFQGESLLQRAVRTLQGIVDEVIVVGPERRGLNLGVRFVTDAWPDGGPLAGIAGGLRAIRSDLAFVVACDIPLLSPAVVRYLLTEAERSGSDAVVPIVRGIPQTLQAAYRRRALSVIESPPVKPGRPSASVLEALAHLDVHWVPEDELRLLDPDLSAFLGANTPYELADLVERTTPYQGVNKERR